jgi:hypothetical protein
MPERRMIRQVNRDRIKKNHLLKNKIEDVYSIPKKVVATEIKNIKEDQGNSQIGADK